MSDNEVDEVAHEVLLQKIHNIGKSGSDSNTVKVKKNVRKVNLHELVDAIHSKKNLRSVRKELRYKKSQKKSEPNVVPTPLHRQLQHRIEGEIAYGEIKKDLDEWAPIVKKNRLAEQIIFPLENDNIPVRTIVQKMESFTPRTPLEIELSKVISSSKNNLTDDVTYTVAEQELLRAMNIEEVKARCAQLQKMRALLGYQQVRLKRKAKIKSKTYHRHLKRQKQKQLFKEFDELIVKDPEAAKEKFEEINRQRILERATLKHRNGSKKIQQLSRYANKDPAIKKLLEEQIRHGREIVEKRKSGMSESDSEAESGKDKKKPLSTQELLEGAIEKADAEQFSDPTKNLVLRKKLLQMRKEKQADSEKSAVEGVKLLQNPLLNPSLYSDSRVNLRKDDLNDDQMNADRDSIKKKEIEASVDNSTIASNSSPINKQTDENLKSEDSSKNEKTAKKKKKSKKKSSKTSKIAGGSVDEILTAAESTLQKRLLKKVKGKKRTEVSCDSVNNKANKANKKKSLKDNMLRKSSPIVSAQQDENEEENMEGDISVDPRHFLQIETSKITQLPADLVDRVEDYDDQMNQEEMIAEAFKDDDVIADFEAEKSAIEDAEEPKDIDLTLPGWGSWTGPGIKQKQKKKNRYIIKAKRKERTDRNQMGLIISESYDRTIEKFQPHSVPFPYTTAEDYEAVLRQPLGKDWNPQTVHRNLTKPTIVTKAGKIIRPLNKQNMVEKNFDL